jgi:hypothetical protein
MSLSSFVVFTASTEKSQPVIAEEFLNCFSPIKNLMGFAHFIHVREVLNARQDFFLAMRSSLKDLLYKIARDPVPLAKYKEHEA